MSDILIKNMEMPKSCYYCPFAEGTWGYAPPNHKWCLITGKDMPTDERYVQGNQFYCPLIEVSTPHGRLIDADSYRKEIRERYESAREWYKEAKTDDIKARAESALFTFTECSLTLRGMPTIIEAEGT